VKVNEDAPLCPNFLKGYCPKGSECKLRHSKECPAFKKTGFCADQQRGKCRLAHRSNTSEKRDGKTIVEKDSDSNTEVAEPTSSLDFSHLMPSFLRSSHEMPGEEEEEEEESDGEDSIDSGDEGELQNDEEYKWTEEEEEDEYEAVDPAFTLSPLMSTEDENTLRISDDRQSSFSNSSEEDESEEYDLPGSSSPRALDLPIPRFLLS